MDFLSVFNHRLDIEDLAVELGGCSFAIEPVVRHLFGRCHLGPDHLAVTPHVIGQSQDFHISIISLCIVKIKIIY